MAIFQGDGNVGTANVEANRLAIVDSYDLAPNHRPVGACQCHLLIWLDKSFETNRMDVDRLGCFLRCPSQRLPNLDAMVKLDLLAQSGFVGCCARLGP